MADEPVVKARSLLNTNRIEALTDGIFAIAMTLMILNLEVPEGIEPENVMTELPEKLLNIVPNFETYVISFLVLGIFWLRHQLQFKHIKNADRMLVWINQVMLMFVALIPFTTNILMTYPVSHLPFLVYVSNLIIIAVILHVHWAYAAKKGKLIDQKLSHGAVEEIKRLNLLGVLLFSASFLLAFISVRAAIFVLYLDPLFYYFYHRYKRYKGVDEE